MSKLATDLPAVVRRPTPDAEAAPSAPHVLIADGDDRTRSAREHQLRLAGFRVSVARTGFEAIVKASCQVPDMILLDDSLSDIKATETGRLLTTCPVTSHIPVVRLLHGRGLPQRMLSRLRRAIV
jgi:CheY-like chemotaxis protein